MPTVTLDVPVELLSATRQSPDDFLREMRLAAAMYWYARGTISQEKAAEVAGLDRTDFLFVVGTREGVGVRGRFRATSRGNRP